MRVERGADTDVDHGDARPDLPREGVHHRSARQEVRHHLRGDLLRPGRHPLGVHAVVAREDRDGRGFRQRRRTRAGDPGEGDGEVLDAAERAARLGHAVEPVAGGRAGLGADGADGGGGVGDDVGGEHPESRPRRAADGQHDLRLASAAGRRPPGTDARVVQV